MQDTKRDGAFHRGGLALAGDGKGQGHVGGKVKEEREKICCVCPDIKWLRDECVVEHGEDASTKWINAHKQCLRAEGFNA
ncbi:cytochrome c oxidase copper chaperone 1 [Carex littledalei]|uniref:Cytochrome c oxidase copper chaperone 1 n=1 Tax=Carex littledalei TaxID=544730 RepID=A0A833RNL8_9POAL|nr:cytochrome c oxidase copper chaperone 1 [Carex littledalei]